MVLFTFLLVQHSMVHYRGDFNPIILTLQMNLASHYPLLARKADDQTNYGFGIAGLKFTQSSFNIFAGLKCS